jgi:hypothetical protein
VVAAAGGFGATFGFAVIPAAVEAAAGTVTVVGGALTVKTNPPARRAVPVQLPVVSTVPAAESVLLALICRDWFAPSVVNEFVHAIPVETVPFVATTAWATSSAVVVVPVVPDDRELTAEPAS